MLRMRVSFVKSAVCLVAVGFLSSCMETLEFPPLFQEQGAASAPIEEPRIANPNTIVVKKQKVSARTRHRMDPSGVPVPGMKPKRALVIQNERAARPRIKSEALLEAQGTHSVVEKSRDYDPAEAHMKARKNVNTRRRSKDNELSAHFQPDAVSGKDGKLRVLSVEKRKSGDRDSDEGFFEKVSSVFSSDPAEGVEDIVIPGRKPLVPKRFTQKAPRSVKRDRSAYRQAISGQGSSQKTKRIVYNYGGQSEGRASVAGLRSGIHPDKTRVVIDITKPTTYKAVIDPLRKVLRVQLENVHWHIPEKGKIEGGAKLLGSYVVKEDGDGGALLEIRLSRSAKLAYTEILEPNITSKYRIVVDLVVQ